MTLLAFFMMLLPALMILASMLQNDILSMIFWTGIALGFWIGLIVRCIRQR